MIKFRLVTFGSIVIIFASVFFIHFAFNNFVRINELCATAASNICIPSNMFLLFVFCFSVVGAFIGVIETAIYFMFKQVEMEMVISSKDDKKATRDIKMLQKRMEEIDKAKSEARKKYLGRKIEEATYRKIKDKYDRELMELEMEVEETKNKFLKKKLFGKLA